MTDTTRRPWDSDVDHSVERLRTVLRLHFPDIAADEVEILGAGWDNTAALVDGRWVFRFARRPVAATLLRNEWAVLPGLADEVPLQIPVPLWFAEADDSIEFPVCGYEWLPGTTACSYPWIEATRAGCAVPVGAFLGALHGVERDTLPDDSFDRVDLAGVLAGLVERGQALRDDDVVPSHLLDPALALATRLVDTAPATHTALLHGDLYARHVLVDDHGKPTGIIDWGDVHRGDPALDLSIAYSFFPSAARDAFFTAYGRPVDAAAHARARFRAVHYGVVLSWFGADIDDARMIDAGATALAYCVD